jgi:hypothetical protein
MANGKKGPEGFGVTIGRQITKETASENGKKGGKASGKARRNKALLKDCLDILLEKKIETKDGKKITGAEATAAALFKKALNGDTRAFELLRDTVGQKPVDKIMISEVDQSVIDEVEAMMNDDEE